MRTINQAGLEIIKKWEGLEDGDPSTSNLDPYVCPANVWTIGWGHAIVYNGRHLTTSNDPVGDLARSLYPGGLNIEQAEQLLRADTSRFAIQVDNLVTVELKDNMFDALVSFSFNVGIGNFQRSTLLRKLNKGDYLGASQEFPKWRRANGVILQGLVHRRADEKTLFMA